MQAANATTHWTGELAALARDIKLSHSVFALPFALLATFLAANWRGPMPTGTELGLILACMVTARTTAMVANRLIDARYDRENPRTAGRAIPSGRLSRTFALATGVACAALFIAACGGFFVLNGNAWPVRLSPVVLGWLVGYSYAKRFTALCHLWLGAALAISPLAAAIALAPGYVHHADVWLLSLMVACWVAGFDVIYSLQDVGFDRGAGLHSLPSKIGENGALWVSRVLHVIAFGALVTLWRVNGALEQRFFAGIVLVAGLLVLEHAIVWRSRTRHLNVAFLTVNGVISLLLGGLGIWDVLAR